MHDSETCLPICVGSWADSLAGWLAAWVWHLLENLCRVKELQVQVQVHSHLTPARDFTFRPSGRCSAGAYASRWLSVKPIMLDRIQATNLSWRLDVGVLYARVVPQILCCTTDANAQLRLCPWLASEGITEHRPLTTIPSIHPAYMPK